MNNNILRTYIMKVIILNMILVASVIISLSSMIRIIDELRKIGERDYSFINIFIYTLLSVPRDLNLFFPMIIFLGEMFGLGVLETRNELIIMKISGMSKLQILWSVIQTLIPVLLFNMIINQYVLPKSELIAYTYRNKIMYCNHDVSVLVKDFWLIEKNDFIYVERILTSFKLIGIKIYRFDQDFQLKKILHIKQANYIDGVWNLLDVDELNCSDRTNIMVEKVLHSIWCTTLTPKKLLMMISNPECLSIFKLHNLTQYLKKTGQNFHYCQFIFLNKILFPFFGFVITILALSCNFGLFQNRCFGLRLLFGSMLSFLFYILTQVVGVLSYSTFNIHPISMMLPGVLFLIVGIFVLCK